MSNGIGNEAVLPRLQTAEAPRPFGKPGIGEKLSGLLTKLHLKSQTKPEDSLAELASLEANPKTEANRQNLQTVTDFIKNTALFKESVSKITNITSHIKENPLEAASIFVPGTLGALSVIGHSPINPDLLNSIPPAFLGRLALITGAGLISADRTNGGVARKVAAGIMGAAGGVVASDIIEKHLPAGEQINSGMSFVDDPVVIGAVLVNAKGKHAKSAVLPPRNRTLIPTNLKPK